MEAKGLTVLARPVDAGVDFNQVDALREAIDNRDGQPLPSLVGPDAVPILPFVLLELDGVENDEHVRRVQLVHVAEPREVLRLMDGDPHWRYSREVRTKMGLLRIRCPAGTLHLQPIEKRRLAAERRLRPPTASGVAPRTSGSRAGPNEARFDREGRSRSRFRWRP